MAWFFYWLLYLLLDGNIFPYLSILYSFTSSISISPNEIPRLGTTITYLSLNFHELFSEFFNYLQKGNLVWNESKYSMLRSFVPLFSSISTNRIPRLGTAITHLTMNVHELFSELFEYLQKENLVRWFFYWLYFFSKDGNIFPYFSTLYSFISSKYLAKWNSKIRHSNNPFEFVDMCVMHHLQYYLSCMEYICTL